MNHPFSLSHLLELDHEQQQGETQAEISVAASAAARVGKESYRACPYPSISWPYGGDNLKKGYAGRGPAHYPPQYWPQGQSQSQSATRGGQGDRDSGNRTGCEEHSAGAGGGGGHKQHTHHVHIHTHGHTHRHTHLHHFNYEGPAPPGAGDGASPSMRTEPSPAMRVESVSSDAANNGGSSPWCCAANSNTTSCAGLPAHSRHSVGSCVAPGSPEFQPSPMAAPPAQHHQQHPSSSPPRQQQMQEEGAGAGPFSSPQGGQHAGYRQQYMGTIVEYDVTTRTQSYYDVQIPENFQRYTKGALKDWYAQQMRQQQDPEDPRSSWQHRDSYTTVSIECESVMSVDCNSTHSHHTASHDREREHGVKRTSSVLDNNNNPASSRGSVSAEMPVPMPAQKEMRRDSSPSMAPAVRQGSFGPRLSVPEGPSISDLQRRRMSVSLPATNGGGLHPLPSALSQRRNSTPGDFHHYPARGYPYGGDSSRASAGGVTAMHEPRSEPSLPQARRGSISMDVGRDPQQQPLRIARGPPPPAGSGPAGVAASQQQQQQQHPLLARTSSSRRSSEDSGDSRYFSGRAYESSQMAQSASGSRLLPIVPFPANAGGAEIGRARLLSAGMEAYMLRRKKNNDAVQKCRAKKRELLMHWQQVCQELLDEQDTLTARRAALVGELAKARAVLSKLPAAAVRAAEEKVRNGGGTTNNNIKEPPRAPSSSSSSRPRIPYPSSAAPSPSPATAPAGGSDERDGAGPTIVGSATPASNSGQGGQGQPSPRWHQQQQQQQQRQKQSDARIRAWREEVREAEASGEEKKPKSRNAGNNKGHAAVVVASGSSPSASGSGKPKGKGSSGGSNNFENRSDSNGSSDLASEWPGRSSDTSYRSRLVDDSDIALSMQSDEVMGRGSSARNWPPHHAAASPAIVQAAAVSVGTSNTQ